MILNFESGLGYVIDVIAQIHQKFIEIHRRSINRLLMAKRVHVRACMIVQSVVCRSVESIRCRCALY